MPLCLNMLIFTHNLGNWLIKNCQERCTKLVYSIFLQEVADHAHPAAVWCSVEQSLIDGTQLTNGRLTCELAFKPNADILNIRCDVTISLFSLYLMNFVLHTMLDAAGVVLRVHYKSMKCDVLFLQGSVRTIFR